MSEFLTALVISGSIFGVMMLSQFGRRQYNWHKVLIPLVSIGVFGFSYLKGAPTTGAALALYGVGIAIGAVFAVLATLSTKVELDNATGKLYTRCGAAFVITWLVAMGLRIGFVWGVDNVSGFRNQVGEFMTSNRIPTAAIAPFFVLMALVTVLGRVAAIKVRAARLVRSTGPLTAVDSFAV